MEMDRTLPAVERIERALLLLAWFIEQDGDVHLPMYERFEAELAAINRSDDVRARARQRLDAYAHSGGLKAIC